MPCSPLGLSMRWSCCPSSRLGSACSGRLGAAGGVLALIKIARYAPALIPLVTTVFRNEGRSLLAALNVMLVLLRDRRHRHVHAGA